MNPGARVLVSVCTYRRNDGLAALLRSLINMRVDASFDVVVVDNSPDRGAATVVEECSRDLHISYAHEPVPGIASARNRSLEFVGLHDYIAFVDDDETVPVDWLDRLLEAANLYDAQIVSGHVRSSFAEGVPPWFRAGRFVQRSDYPEGQPGGLAATNNTLVSVALLRRAEWPKFDESYGLTGGSDSEFFARLQLRFPHKHVWTSKATVHEHFPEHRANLGWVWKRSVRLGNVKYRIRHDLVGERRVALVANGVARSSVGILDIIATGVLARSLSAKGFRHVGVGIGMVRAAFGVYRVEYARAPSGSDAKGVKGGRGD